MRRINCPNESFFDKGLRYANTGIAAIGTARGLYEAGQTIYGGMQAVGRIGAAMAPAAAAIL
jgi:hypothetical protein